MLEDISFDCLFDDFASDSGCSDADLLGATSSADSSSVTSLEQIAALGVASGQKRNCTEFDFGYVSDLSSQGKGNAHKKTKSVSADSTSSANGEDQSTNDYLKKEHRLIRNRESANKCRQKKKTEMQNLNSKISELMGKILSLTQENAGLRADNISLTDHNRFLRNLLASKLELPLHDTPATTTSNLPAKTKSTTGIAMLGLFGAVAIVKNVCSGSVSESYVGGRILLSDYSTQDIEHGNSLYLAVVGVFACLILLFSLQFFQEQKPDKKTYLP